MLEKSPRSLKQNRGAMDTIAVLLPCYNEGKTIVKVVADSYSALPNVVIYIYDNNSADDTYEQVRAGWDGVIVRHEYKQGKGNVIRRMFREIDAHCYVMADGDDTYPAEYAPALVEQVLERHADMAVGDRLSSTYFEENKRRFHNAGNTLVRSLVNRIFDADYKDIMTGYRAFSYIFVKSFPVLTQGFEIETEMSIFAADRNFQIENVVVGYRDRPEGSESKLNTIPDGIKVVFTIVRLFRNYRPLLFFGLLALLLMVVSLVFFVPLLLNYFKTGLVGKMPTLVVSCFVFIAALMSYFAGLILETIRQKNRSDFEFQLQQTEANRKELEREATWENPCGSSYSVQSSQQ